MGLDDAELAEAKAARAGGRPTGFRAPSVVVVVVTCDAGDWFEEALAGLAAQAYPNLAVLVVDTGSRPAQPRVEAVLPHAHVHVAHGAGGFAAAANELLDLVAGAAFYAICHDDVQLAPDAIRCLVDEAARSDAGIVGPKLVAWDDPATLLQVGQSADKTGVPAPLAERGELDQEQHDAVRDVFTIPGGCTLIRSELFHELEGFDPAMTFLGEDLDLCWRAQIAGARVVVVPAAVARHREGLAARRPLDDRRRLAARHRLRSVLTCYGPFHLARVLPWALALTVVEAAYALVTGRLSQAADVLGAWTWNLRRLPELRRRRLLVHRTRRLPDGEVRRLQVRGSARLNAYVRGELGGAGLRSLSGRGRELGDSVAVRSGRLDLAVWLVLALVLVVGTRGLIGDRLPAIGSFTPFSGPVELLRAWTSGYRDAGLGSVGPSPTAFGLLGLGGIAALGQEGFLQQVLVLGTLPLGLLGMWRLSGPIGSRRGRLLALVAYAALPLAYDAVAGGEWGTLALHAVAPWLLGALLRAAAVPPFGAAGGLRDGLRRTLGLGVLVAVVAALVPLVALVVPVVAVALVAGGLLAGSTRGARSLLAVAGGSTLVALVLHLPWSFELLAEGGTWRALGGLAPVADDRVPVVELLRFGSGDPGPSVLHAATVAAAAVALVVGRSWRWALAVRLWAVALACWGLAVAQGAGLDLPSTSLLLVPAAVAIALSVGLGVAAVEQDLLEGRDRLRQVTAAVLAAVVVVGALPVLAGAVDGRWGAPRADFAATLGFTGAPEVTAEGAFRVLWVGHPANLPVGSHELADGVAYGISDGGEPGIRERWAPAAADDVAAEVVELAAAGRTDRLGRLLAPLGIRYLVLPERAAPERELTPVRPVPPGLLRTAERQLDLRAIEVDGALAVFENTAWAPVRALVPDAEVATFTGSLVPDDLGLDLAGATDVLPEQRHLQYRGEVGAGTLYVAQSFAERWQLRVGDQEADQVEALGWASAFDVPRAGDATLVYATAPWHRIVVVVQVALWLATAAALVRTRPRTGAR